MMDELLEKGQEICGVKLANQTKPRKKGSPTTIPTVFDDEPKMTTRRPRFRGRRQVQLRDIIKTVREVGTAIRGDGSKGSGLLDIFNDFQNNLKTLAEGGGGPLDEALTQVANLLGFNVTNSLDIIPALFMKAFTDTTVSLFFHFHSKT